MTTKARQLGVRTLLANINDAAQDGINDLPCEDEMREEILRLFDTGKREDLAGYLANVEAWRNKVAARLDQITSEAEAALDLLYEQADQDIVQTVAARFKAVHGDRSEPEHSRELDQLREAIYQLTQRDT